MVSYFVKPLPRSRLILLHFSSSLPSLATHLEGVRSLLSSRLHWTPSHGTQWRRSSREANAKLARSWFDRALVAEALSLHKTFVSPLKVEEGYLTFARFVVIWTVVVQYQDTRINMQYSLILVSSLAAFATAQSSRPAVPVSVSSDGQPQATVRATSAARSSSVAAVSQFTDVSCSVSLGKDFSELI